jgi:hypothetical protein
LLSDRTGPLLHDPPGQISHAGHAGVPHGAFWTAWSAGIQENLRSTLYDHINDKFTEDGQLARFAVELYKKHPEYFLEAPRIWHKQEAQECGTPLLRKALLELSDSMDRGGDQRVELVDYYLDRIGNTMDPGRRSTPSSA